MLIDALAIEGTLDGESFDVAVDGDCVSARFQGETFEQCAADATAAPELEEMFADAPSVTEFLEALSESFADIEPIGLELRHHEGAWYVSPVSTYSEALLKALRALDRAEIDRLIDLGERAFEEGFDELFFGTDDFMMDDEFAIDEMTSGDLTFDEMTGDEMTGDEMTFEASAWDVCYEAVGVAAAAACFPPFVDSGELDP